MRREESLQPVPKSTVPGSTKHLLSSIKKQDELQVAANLRQYHSQGVIAFEKVLSIPLTGRIPHLTHVYGLENLHKLMIILLARFNNDLNLIRPMSAEQVTDCAFDLVMTTQEDYLSIEDYMLFFKGAKEGKYGRILDRLDSQTVFALLEEYREQRHSSYRKIQESRHLEYKGSGPSDRTNQPSDMDAALHSLTGRIADLKDRLQEQREINKLKTWGKE